MRKAGQPGRPVGRWWGRGASKPWHPGARQSHAADPGVAAALRRNVVRLLAIVALLPAAASDARAQDAVQAQQSGNLLWKAQNGYEAATRLNTDVDVTAASVSAATRWRTCCRTGQSHEAIFGFPATATVAPMMRLTGLACVLLATLLLLVRVLTLKPRKKGA